MDAEPYGLRKIGINLNQLDGYRDMPIKIESESDFNLINDETETIQASNVNLTHLPELPEGLIFLYCRNNKLTSLPKLPENLIYLDCSDNKLKSLPELPESINELYCSFNPLEYPIPHKYYKNQIKDWLKELNIKLNSYEHQKKLIEKNGIYIMKKFENHPELINDKIKEENPTYFLSVEYGF